MEDFCAALEAAQTPLDDLIGNFFFPLSRLMKLWSMSGRVSILAK
jgi:hypothetical protein